MLDLFSWCLQFPSEAALRCDCELHGKDKTPNLYAICTYAVDGQCTMGSNYWHKTWMS